MARRRSPVLGVWLSALVVVLGTAVTVFFGFNFLGKARLAQLCADAVDARGQLAAFGLFAFGEFGA
ncbi:hypothetical protein [Hyphomicrobium sp. MC8b]|uniref:hypothetical protein n=1 Tax=Hyphomicrobium sp. MC8b TaxID=300273 RepID=UPI00391B013C